MLNHRSFKPTKCKTALKLAVSRIKLLRNKREAQVKQLRKELAQLLHPAHNRLARVRVELVTREEKTMAAYDLIEIYCELIAARLPMIESQKNCPIDLKEAISSVIFASPRCVDIPELMDVRKHILAKYGKEFVTAAIELRPDCGVNRLLVEKLSTNAPDGPTKIKILTAIAEEHNVKWQPSLEENDVKLSQDFLVGPNTFDKATYVEPPQLHVPPVGDKKGPPNLHASYQLKELHDMPTNSYEQNASFATNSLGTGNQEMDFRDVYQENKCVFQMGRQSWNMYFKDVASAAQVAAESAERASMAASAIVELSKCEKLTKQYSSGWHSSSGEYAFHVDKHVSADSVNSTFQREQLDAREQHYLVGSANKYYMNSTKWNVEKHYHETSLKSENASEEASNKKSSSRDSKAYFGSDTTGDSKDTGFSRRTLAPSKIGLGWKPSRVSYESEDDKASFMDNWASSKHGSMEHATSKPGSNPNASSSEKIVTSSTRVQPSSSLPKTMTSVWEGASKSLNSKEDNVPSKGKANHVHPKLPDYDTFIAQFLSLKKSHQ